MAFEVSSVTVEYSSIFSCERLLGWGNFDTNVKRLNSLDSCSHSKMLLFAANGGGEAIMSLPRTFQLVIAVDPAAHV